jgi:hypothetical protein
MEWRERNRGESDSGRDTKRFSFKPNSHGLPLAANMLRKG